MKKIELENENIEDRSVPFWENTVRCKKFVLLFRRK